MASSLFPLHFETGRHKRVQVFLADDEYAKCLDTLTKACTDLLVVNKETKKVLIGKRRVHPQPDWWYGAGGRMKPGETPFESAARILKRELGLVLEESAKKHVREGGRFTGIGAYSYTWEFREQSPQDHGCADISVVMSIELTPTELSGFKSDNVEYEDHAWVECMEIVNDASKHPALRRSAADLMRAQAWDKITLDASKVTDAELGKTTREFIQFWTAKDAELLAHQDAHNGNPKSYPPKRLAEDKSASPSKQAKT